jgi:transcriptional regulator with GAF, ATPase, and Fis domain
MRLMHTSKSSKGSSGLEVPMERERYERLAWMNWLLLGGVSIVTNPWPWVPTDTGLVIGLGAALLVFIAHLTFQQRRIAAMGHDLERMRDEAAERARQHYIRLYAFLNVSKIMGAEVDIQNVFTGITSLCLETFDCDQASLMLLDGDAQTLTVRAATGPRADDIVGKQMKIGDGVSGWVAKHREPIILRDGTEISQYPGLTFTSRSIPVAMIVPIILRDELVGVLNVSSKISDVDYSDEDLQALLVFAENAGTCIRHTQQAQWMRQTIQSLQQALHDSGSPVPAHITQAPERWTVS